jgi:hypothetical protein
MGARKNNPNKFGVGSNFDKADPKGVMADFAAREGFRLNPAAKNPRIFAWEIVRGFTFDTFECALITYDPVVRLWAITHNAITESGSDRFKHHSPQAAWDWYKSPRPKQS